MLNTISYMQLKNCRKCKENSPYRTISDNGTVHWESVAFTYSNLDISIDPSSIG